MAGTNTKKAWDAALGKSGSNTKSAKSTNSGAQKKKIWDELLKADTASTNRYADASTINWLFDEDAERFHQSYSGQVNAGAAYNASKNTQQAVSGIFDRNAGSSIRSSGIIPSTQAANEQAQLAQKQLEEGRNYISNEGYAGWQEIAGTAYANTDVSNQNILRARRGDASVLTDQRAAIDQLRKDGQHDNWWNRLWGTHSYTNQEEIDAAEKEYQKYIDLLQLNGMETIRDRKPRTSMIDYTEDDYYADLNTILHKAQGIDIPQEDYLEAAKRVRGFVGSTAVEQEAFADPSGQWMDKYRGLYGQRMDTLDMYIDKYSGAAGTEYDFSAEDYITYQRAYDRYMERQAEQEQALSAAAQKEQDKWGGLENRPDFATYSAHVPTEGSYYDEYDVLNWRAQVNDMVALGANPERFEDAASILSLDPVIDSDAYPYLEYGLQYLTDQDRARFFYLYNNPEYGPDAALEYLEDIGYRTMRANTEAYQDAIAQGADDSALTSAALSVAAPFYGLMNSVASLNTLAYKATGREVNPYDPTFLYGTMRDTIVGEVGSNIAEATDGAPRLFGQNIFQMGYNAVMSAAESALNVRAFGRAGTVPMGMGAFNSSYQQGLAAGKPDTDAFIDALVDGAIETGTEYFSVEALLSDPTSPLGYFLKNRFTEGAEEGTGTILRTGYDQWRNGIDSAINTRIDELRAMGYSPTEAKRTAVKEWLNELAGDVTTGMISGGVMSGPGAVQSYAENRSTGKALQENAGETGYQSLIDLADTVELSGSGRKILDKLKGRLAQQSYGSEVAEGLSTEAMQDEKNQQAQQETEDRRAAQVEDDLSAEAARDELADDKNQQAQQRGKEKISRAKLGQLYREVMQKLDEKAQDVLREFMSFDLSKELQRLGLPVQEAKDLARSVLRIQDGSFTEADVQAVSGSTEAREALSAWTTLAGAVNKAKGAVSKMAGMLEKKDSANAETETSDEPGGAEAEAPEDEFDVKAAEVQAEAENLLSSEGEASTLDGEEIEVIGVAPADGAESDGAPKLRIRTADGAERSVAAKDIAYGTKDAGVYQLAAYAGKYERNADQMYNLRLSGQDVNDYARAFSKAAQAGSDGRNLSLLVDSGAVDVLTPGQAQAAYDIGRSLRAQRSQAQQEALGAKGVNVQVGRLDVSQIERVSLNKQQRASVDAMGKLAKALGINVRFVESKADESGRYTTENGSYDPNTRTLTLDIHAGSNFIKDTRYAVMNTAGHELTHYIRQFADSALWDGYQDFVMDHLDGKVNLEKEIQKRMAQNNKLDRDGAIEEIVADASGEALSRLTETQLQELAQENPTLLKKIARFMKKWISNLKRQIELAFKGTEAKTEVARQMQDALDEMAEMWNGLLVEASRTANQTAFKANQTVQKASPAAAQTTAQTTQTKATQEAEKLFIPYAHIDQRDIFSVKEEHTELFCGEVEEARVCYTAAAEVLLDDLNVSVPGQKIYIRDSQGALSVTGQNRTTSDLLARMKDETGWTWDEIWQTLTAFADMGSADKGYPLVKNTIRNRRMEVYLHEMLTRGYKTLDGTQLAPWREYVEAMAAYQGSKGAGLDAQPPKDAIPFEEYAFADEFADDGDVKYSIRSFADGSQFVHVDTEQKQFEGLTGNELRKKAHEYLIQNFRGKVAGTIVRAYVTGVSERKLLYPNKTQDMRIIEAISKAVPELGNLLDASKLLTSEPDSTTHAHGDKVIGWRKYRTVFEVGGMFIEGTTNIQITQHGDVYYGMSKLKDISNSPTVQAYLSGGDRTNGDVLDPTIAQPDDSVKFSLRAPVENSGNLIAVHNLTEGKLSKALNLGGFPMPSIAIAKTDIGHQNFGDISLVFGRETIDPKANRKNKVYSADAWTPTFPRIEYEADAKVEKRIRTTLNRLGDGMEQYLKERMKQVVYGIDEYLNRFEGEQGFIEYAMQNYGLKAAFLEDQDQHVDMVKTEKRVGKEYSEAMAASYQKIIDLFGGDMYEALQMPLGQIRDEYGDELEQIRPGSTKSAMRLSAIIRNAAEYQQTANQPARYEMVEDYGATERSIDEQIDQDAFRAWVKDLFSGIEGNSGVYNNKPLFTDSGNRRSFASTHMPVTVENIAKAMATQGNTKNIAGFHGIKSVRAATARTFKDVAEMHKYEGRIQNRTEAEAEALNEALNERLYGLIHEVMHARYPNGNTGLEYTYAEDALGEIFLEMAGSKYNAASIQNALAGYGYTVRTETAEDIKQLFDEAAMMPVNMYEAKPERAVGFDEVKFAVVPDNMSADVIDALSEAVPDVRTYPAGDETARLEQLNSREDVRFSHRYDYDTLVSKPDMRITTLDNTDGIDRRDAFRRGRENVMQYAERFDTTGTPMMYVPDLGKYVVVGRKALEHGLDRRVNKQGAVVARIGDILNSSIVINEADPKKAGVRNSWILLGAAMDGNGRLIYVRSVVNQSTLEVDDVSALYAVYGKTKEAGRVVAPEARTNGSGTPSNLTISIADLLEGVNGLFDDVISEDVANRLGVERSESEFTERLRFQQRDPDQISDRELLATALQNVTQNADEWDNLRRYQKKIAALNEKQRMLEQTDARIAELKGKSDRASRDELIRMQNNARTLARSIERADGELLKYEAMKPIKKLAERQREDYRQKLKERTDERMRKYKERLKQDMQDRIREVREREAERGKQRLDKAVEHAREVGNRRVDRLKESEAKAKYRERIQKDVSTLREWLTQPTNKGHVPQFLRAPLADFLESLDFTSARALRGGDATKADQKMLEKMDALRRALANTRSQQADIENGEAAYRGYLDLPEGFADEFDAAVADIRATLEQGGTDIPVNRMTAEQLKTLSNMIRTINTAVRKANSFLANRRYRTVSGAAQDSIRALSRLGAKSVRNAILEKAGGFLDWTNATPYYVFKRFGDGGKAVFEGLMDGWDRLAFNSRRLIDFANSCYTTGQVRAWSQELHEIKLNGVSVQMTTAQIMSLYCLNKRAQARGHLLGGGMRIADIATRGKTITQADNHILGAQDIANITKLLTAEQRSVADKLQAFMNTVCTDWGNEVSMQRFGYDAFGDEANYFPIETDSNNRKAIDEQAQENSLFRLLNLSATKSTIKNANNALVVRDIFDVFSAHCTDMAKYNALALPILDALKWYNYVEKTNFEDGSLATESVQKALEKAYGKDAQKYIKNFLRDLNGVREGGRNDGLFSKMTSNYKIAAVAANLRVGLLQITSMPRAAYAIDPKYLAIGVAKNATFQNSRRAEANVGICLWKSLGFYDTNISRNVREMVKHDQSVGGKIKEKSMILAEKGDAWTMGVLYGAVEAEMADKRPGVAKGSKAYNEMVNARVREIVYQTQVVDSTMTRSDIMRDTGAKSSLATAFMSEPTLTMNMLADSIYEQRMKARESGKKLIAPSKKMVRAFAVNAVVLAFSSVMEAAFTAWRDDDEYETFAEKFDDSFIDTLLENMNPANNLPFVKDVAEALQGRSTARMDNTWAYTLGQGVTEVYKYLTGQSKNPAYNGIYKTLNGLSQMSGFAVGGLTREVVSLYNNLIAAPMGYTRIQTYADSASDAADAILRAYAAGDDGLVERYIGIAAKHGIEADKLENAIKSAAGEAFVAGELDADGVRAVLKEHAGKSDADVDELLLKWGYKVQTGLEYSDMKDDYIAGNIDRATALEYYGEDKVAQWDYERETGSSYADMREEYISGRMTASQAREYLMTYGGKTEAKAAEQIDRWDCYAATGESDNYTKYWRMYYAFENGGDFRKYAQEWIDAGVKRSNIAASIAGRYKEEYLAIKGTAAGDAMLERLLDLYEAIGYDREYEREYINSRWKLD